MYSKYGSSSEPGASRGLWSRGLLLGQWNKTPGEHLPSVTVSHMTIHGAQGDDRAVLVIQGSIWHKSRQK